MSTLSGDVLAPGFSTEPYWTDGLPAFVPPQRELDARVDVAVVGAGYAGLSAALTLARAGMSVAVFEAARVGSGASSRSAGSLGHVPKAGLTDLKARYGESVAHRVYAEAREARQVLGREELRMRDAVAEPERRPRLARTLERVERLAVRAVADRVDGYG